MKKLSGVILLLAIVLITGLALAEETQYETESQTLERSVEQDRISSGLIARGVGKRTRPL